MSTTSVDARYAAPTATVSLDSGSADGAPAVLKRRSVLLMIVFTFVTLGLYPVIWLMRRRQGLNALDSPRKLSPWPPRLILVAVLLGPLVVAMLGAFIGDSRDIVQGLLMLNRLGVGIALIVEFFAVRRILEDHLSTPREAGDIAIGGRSISGAMTFFFSAYYLQYIINRDIVPAHR